MVVNISCELSPLQETGIVTTVTV